MSWRFCNGPQEAEHVTAQLRGIGQLPANAGVMNWRTLLLHAVLDEDCRVTVSGGIYLVPDTLYHYVSQVWLTVPQAVHTLHEAVEMFRARYGDLPVVGLIPWEKVRWLNALVKKGDAQVSHLGSVITW